MALSKKQAAFVEFYLTHWNATRAAILAGYSEQSARSIGSENLTKPDIRQAIQERLTELKMGADEVLTRLSDQARGSVAVFIDVSDADQNIETAENMDEAHAAHVGWRLNLAKAKKADKLHLIKKLKAGQWGPEIELHDAQAALALMGKHHALFSDTTFNIDLGSLTDEQLDMITAGVPIATVLRKSTKNTTSDSGSGGD